MKLEWIKIKNFRGYHGEQSLRFSQNKDRNVTIIRGVNGAGKTSLFTALNWCLYGIYPDDIGELTNKRAIAESRIQGEIESKVQVAFLHEGKQYTATRTEMITKTGEHDGEWQLLEKDWALDIQRSDGQTEPVGNPTPTMESILPSNVRSYFFFDGEKLDSFVKSSNEDEVEYAVKQVLKIEIFERSKTHMHEIYARNRRELRKFADDNLDELIQREEELESRKASILGEIDHLRNERRYAERQELDIRNKLTTREASRQWEEQRKSIELDKQGHERELQTIEDGLKAGSTLGYFSFVFGAVNQALAILDDKRIRGEMPQGIREQFVKDLIDQHLCICGRSIEDESEEHSQLLRVLENTMSSGLEDTLIQTAGDLRNIRGRLVEPKNKLKELTKARRYVIDQIDTCRDRLEEISSHLSSSEQEDIAELEQKLKTLQQSIQSLSSDLGRADERLKTNSDVIAENKLAQEKAEVSGAQAEKLQKLANLAERSANAIEETIEKFAKSMRINIQAEANRIFKSFIWKSTQWQDLRVNDDYRLEVIDRWGFRAADELSAGEREVLSFAFITAMGKVSGQEAPFVIDMPLGRLSGDHKANIAKNLPDVTDQLILLITDMELNEASMKNLEQRIGAEHQLTEAAHEKRRGQRFQRLLVL